MTQGFQGDGGNAFGAPVRPATRSEIGKGFSGSILEVDSAFLDPETLLPGAGGWPQLLDCDHPPLQPDGFQGMAAIHVWAESIGDEPPIPLPGPAPGPVENAVLVGILDWQNGRGGGRQLVDLTRGTLVPVGGKDFLSFRVALVSSVDGEPVIVFRKKKVQATVNWHGQAIEPALYSSAKFRFGGSGTSAFRPIPPQAKQVVVQGSAPTLFPAMTLELSTNRDPLGSGVKIVTLNPNANTTFVTGGVEFWRIVSGGAGLFGPVWELY